MTAVHGWPVAARLVLRRERWALPIWSAAFVAVAAGSAASVLALYATPAAWADSVAAVNATPSLLALYGPVYDATGPGALALWKPAGSGALLLGVLTAITVLRHTRSDEEVGRSELLGATSIGRAAPLVAAVLVTWAASIVLGAATAAALWTTGLPAAGSVAFGAAWAGCGIVFAGVGGLAAQFARSRRAAGGLVALALAAAFALRAVGDATGPSPLSWISPLGWVQQVRAFAGERWWVLLLPVALGAALLATSTVVAAGRDLGAGLVPDRPGPSEAGTGLRGPFTLAWRLQRATLLAWTVGFALAGALLGGLASDIGGILGGDTMREIVQRLGGDRALTDAFLAADMAVLGILAAAYALQTVARLHAEESGGLAEPLLAAGVGRTRWASAQLLTAGAGATLLLLAAGVGAGIARGAQTGDPAGEVARLSGAALAQLPAVFVVAAVALLVYGVAPRWTSAAWVVFAGFLVLAELGPFLRLSSWALDLSPFTHLPRLPGPLASPAPLLWLVVVAAALAAAGLGAFRRRDLN